MSLNFAHNSTINQTTIFWQPEPQLRGTWSIISVCTLTTSLCVWTAIHLNVPAVEQKYPQHMRKLYWLVIGLSAPELVAYAAWYQRLVVAKYHEETLVLLGQKPSISWLRRVWQWLCAMAHCGDHNGQAVVRENPSLDV